MGANIHGSAVAFRVWAPFAVNVALLVDDNGERKTFPMEKDGAYWHLETHEVRIGQNYQYLITTADGRELARNDPYARRLTSASGGWSVVVQDDFDWSDDTFTQGELKKQTIYELHVGTFNRPSPSTPGTFASVIEKIPYLKDLGITAIELMPVTSMMDDTGWGYAPTHIFSIEEAYGGRHGLMSLVKAAHQAGIAVIIDMVYNHMAPKNELDTFDGWSENDGGGIYFYNDERGVTPWGNRPDYGRDEVRSYLLDNITMWFNEFHVDGMRLDATYYIDEIRDAGGIEQGNIPDGWTLMQKMTTLAHKLKPSAWMIAEDSGWRDEASSPVQFGGLGFDAQWGTHFPLAIRSALGVETPQNIDVFISELQRYFNGEAFQKIIYSDSHDSAANGHERLNEEASDGGADKIARAKALIASTIAFTAPGVPMILQGVEFVESGYFAGWRELNWEHEEKFAGIVAAHRDLMHLRTAAPGLAGNGFLFFHVNYTDGVIGYTRWHDAGKDDVLVLINLGKKVFTEYELVLPRSGIWNVAFNSTATTYGADFSDSFAGPLQPSANGKVTLRLEGYQTLIFTLAT